MCYYTTVVREIESDLESVRGTDWITTKSVSLSEGQSLHVPTREAAWYT